MAASSLEQWLLVLCHMDFIVEKKPNNFHNTGYAWLPPAHGPYV